MSGPDTDAALRLPRQHVGWPQSGDPRVSAFPTLVSAVAAMSTGEARWTELGEFLLTYQLQLIRAKVGSSDDFHPEDGLGQGVAALANLSLTSHQALENGIVQPPREQTLGDVVRALVLKLAAATKLYLLARRHGVWCAGAEPVPGMNLSTTAAPAPRSRSCGA
ncbi:MAG: hypothetical protein ACRDQU_11485 [Pseudonocardiaceae bacterium]